MVLGAVCEALGARAPLSSANDYYYTTPATTNIFGRVMGEHGDYRLVRAEDVAFINEAWAERIVLAEDRADTNAVPRGPLVKGNSGYWFDTPSTTAYWTNATLRTCAVTNVHLQSLYAQATMACVLAAGSDGTMTNAERAIDGIVARKLVSLGGLTNAYATLKGMDTIVKSVEPKSTNMVNNITWSVYREDDGPDIAGATTNAVGLLSTWDLIGEGESQKFISRHWDSPSERWIVDGLDTYDWKYKAWPEGSGTVQLEFWVRSTNDWLRGEDSPKVVRVAHAWGVLHVHSEYIESEEEYTFDDDDEGTGYDVSVVTDEEAYTNATVLLDLGEARWLHATTNSLVYEVGLDVAPALAACLEATPWMPGADTISGAASYPGVSVEEGTRQLMRRGVASLERVYLVLWLKPVASLDGW